MTVQEHIAAILDQPVFGGELYYIQHPDPDSSASAVAQTYGIFTIVGGPSFQTLEGDIDLSKPRLQVSVYSTDPLDLIAKVKAVNDAMKAAAVLAQSEDWQANPLALVNYSASVPVDGFEQDTRRFYSHMDFYCWSNQ